MDEFFPSVRATGHGEIEIRFRKFGTHEARWMSYKVLTLTDGAGATIGFATVSQDITERKKLEDNLRRLATDLAEVDRRKNEFLATLSHELRNPLAPLRNMLEILKRTNGRAETAPQAIETMERQLGHLVRLVDDLLDLSPHHAQPHRAAQEPGRARVGDSPGGRGLAAARRERGARARREAAARADPRERGSRAPGAGLRQPAQQQLQVHPAGRKNHRCGEARKAAKPSSASPTPGPGFRPTSSSASSTCSRRSMARFRARKADSASA